MRRLTCVDYTNPAPSPVRTCFPAHIQGAGKQSTVTLMTDAFRRHHCCASSSMAPIAISKLSPSTFALQADGDFPDSRKTSPAPVGKAPQRGFMLLFHFQRRLVTHICNTRSGLCKKLACRVMTSQKAPRPGSCNHPACSVQIQCTRAGGDFRASQTLRTDKSLPPRVAGMPNQNEFGQTRHD